MEEWTHLLRNTETLQLNVLRMYWLCLCYFGPIDHFSFLSRKKELFAVEFFWSLSIMNSLKIEKTIDLPYICRFLYFQFKAFLRCGSLECCELLVYFFQRPSATSEGKVFEIFRVFEAVCYPMLLAGCSC